MCTRTDGARSRERKATREPRCSWDRALFLPGRPSRLDPPLQWARRAGPAWERRGPADPSPTHLRGQRAWGHQSLLLGARRSLRGVSWRSVQETRRFLPAQLVSPLWHSLVQRTSCAEQSESEEVCRDLNFCIVSRAGEKKKKQKTRARPGFEPGTSRTQSENHTPRPTSQCDKSGFISSEQYFLVCSLAARLFRSFVLHCDIYIWPCFVVSHFHEVSLL